MSLSAEITRFLLVAAVYVGFAFLWGWYKGRQEETSDGETASGTTTGGSD